MYVLGLTGGIGMGKSTAAAAFRRARIPVFDADRTGHDLQAPGGRCVPLIAEAFPGTVADGVIDRRALRERVIGDESAMRRLEQILHPVVRKAQHRFLARSRAARQRLVVLDIPLLLETGGDALVDLVVVISAPAAVQRARLRRRRKLTEDQITALVSRQMPDAEKRRRADIVIRSGLSRAYAQAAIRRLIGRSLGR